MGDVIDIEANQPHETGRATCLACLHKWVAVAPVHRAEPGLLECPKCHGFTGSFFSRNAERLTTWGHTHGSGCWKRGCIDPEHGPSFAKMEPVLVALDALTERERHIILRNFCRHCGSDDPGCPCWNDE